MHATGREIGLCDRSIREKEVISYWLLVVGCWLLVVGCWLLVVGYWLLVVGYWLLVIGYLLSVPMPCAAFFPARPNAQCPAQANALRGPSSQCPIPNSLCPMPNAQFAMPNSLCPAQANDLFCQCPIQILDAGAVEKFLNCFIF
jgi:hypothetical protein